MARKASWADEAFSTMNVYLKKEIWSHSESGWDCKRSMLLTEETLKAVTWLDLPLEIPLQLFEKLENENILSGTLRSLFAVAESYQI